MVFTQLSTRADMPGLLAAAWWILALSMPVLASIAILPLVDDYLPVPGYEMLRTTLFFGATLGTVVAIACVFSHFRRGAGIVFLVVAAGVFQLQRVSAKRRIKEDDKNV